MLNNQNDDFNNLVSSIINDLTKGSDENITQPQYLPSKNAVIEIIEIIRNLLFPRVF